jgi:hypothetical protein
VGIPGAFIFDFDAPGAGTGAGYGTVPDSLNDVGMITVSGVNYSFSSTTIIFPHSV